MFTKPYNLLLLIAVLTLSACSTLSPPLKPANHYLTWQQRQHQLQNISSWKTSGILGISYNAQNSIAHFSWQQMPLSYEITLSSALDIGSIKITGNKKEVTLWKSSTDKITAATPEELMQAELGWGLPLENLKYWARGLPVPHSKYNAKFDRYNHIVSLSQNGWQIKYLAYGAVKNIDLPTKILLTTQGLRIKVVIKIWNI